MSKFESMITQATNHKVKVIDARDIQIEYFYPDDNNLLEVEGICDISSVDWSKFNLDPSCELEMACICGSQMEYKGLGSMDQADPKFLTPRGFKFLRQGLSVPHFVLNVFKPSKNELIANSQRITGQANISDDQGLFHWDYLDGDYAWDVGFQAENGPTIYINREKIPLIDDWIPNEKLIWNSLLIPTCLRECITLYFKNRNNSGKTLEPWVDKYDKFINDLNIPIDPNLFTTDIEFEDDQIEKAKEIVNKYCSEKGTINRVLKTMNSIVGET